MELMRFHNSPLTDTGNGISSIWLMILLSLLLAPTAFIKPEDKPDKEE